MDEEKGGGQGEEGGKDGGWSIKKATTLSQNIFPIHYGIRTHLMTKTDSHNCRCYCYILLFIWSSLIWCTL